MERFRLGEHAYIRVLNKDDSGTLTDCDSGYPKLTLYDPAENVIVDAAAMTKQDTGDYYYEPELVSTSSAGSWRWDAEHCTNSKKIHSEGAVEVIE